MKHINTLWLLVGACAAYCALIPVLPDHPALLWLTSVLILANFVLSMWHLIRRGKLSWDVLCLNVMQLVLFGCLHVQIHATRGAHHYAYAVSPRWYHWVQLIMVHVLRAIDVLDGIEAYGISLQNVRNATALSGTVLVAMHIMVDVFMLSAIVQFVRRRFASGKSTGALRSFLNNVAEHGGVIRWLALGLVVGLVVIVALLSRWSAATWFLWPLDNVLRTVDIGDAFQIYRWRLHPVEMVSGLATLAVAVRLVAGWNLAPLVARILLGVTRGRAKTVEELLDIVRSPASDKDAVRIAIDALGAKGRNAVAAVPDLVKALTHSDHIVRMAVAEALPKIDPQWGDSEGAKRAAPDLVKALADEEGGVRRTAAEALGRIRASAAVPDLFKALADQEGGVRRVAAEALGRMGASVAVPDLVKALAHFDGSVRRAAAEALGRIRASAPAAVPDLIKALGDSELLVRSAAAEALDKIDPDHRLHQH